MIVGVDTYHDSAKKGRSVGAFIASMNQTLTRYYSNCGFQSSHEELQNNLCTFMLGMMSQSWLWSVCYIPYVLAYKSIRV